MMTMLVFFLPFVLHHHSMISLTSGKHEATITVVSICRSREARTILRNLATGWQLATLPVVLVSLAVYIHCKSTLACNIYGARELLPMESNVIL